MAGFADGPYFYKGQTYYSQQTYESARRMDERMANAGQNLTTGSGAMANYNTQATNYLSRVQDSVNSLLGGAKAPNAQQSSQQGLGAATAAAQGNVNRVLANLPKVIDTVTASGKDIDAYIQEATYKMLDQFAPGWQGMMESTTEAAGQVADFAQSFLKQVYPKIAGDLTALGDTATRQAQTMMQGQVPGDVMAQIRAASAERATAGMGMTGGAAGSASRNLVARDLGLTSLQIKTQGQSMAQTAAGLYGQLTSAGTATGALLGAPASVGQAGASAINQLAPDLTGKDWLSTINNLVGTLGQAGTVNPTQVMSNFQQSASEAANFDWVKRLSQANLMLSTAGANLGMGYGQTGWGGIR